MAARSRVDSSYADIVGGILMGTVPQNEATNLEVVRGTIEQAMLSTGLTSWLEMIQDPKCDWQNLLWMLFKQALRLADSSSHRILQLFIDWAIKSVTSAINVAVTSSNYSESSQQSNSQLVFGLKEYLRLNRERLSMISC